ncbi:MAG: hypothetical protein WC645_01685 [Candidatus Margulisiibacteriota bacterium]
MKKLIAALGLILLFSGAALAAIDYPSNPAVSPVDINGTTAGWQGYLYVPNTTLNTVTPVYIDYATAGGAQSAGTPINVGGKPRGIAVSPDGQLIYVATNTTIRSYAKDGGTPGTLLSSTSFNSLRGIALSPDGTRLYAADPSANKVHVLNVTGGTITYNSSIVVDGVTRSSINADGAFSVTISPDDGLLVIVKRSDVAGNQHTGAISFIRIVKVRNLDGTYTISYDSTSLAGKNISALNFPTYALISSDPQRVYVRTHEDGTGTYPNADVLIFDGATLDYLANMNIESLGRGRDHEPVGMSINGKYLYLTHYKSTDGYAHAYRVSTSLNNGTPRTNWAWDTSIGDLEYSFTGLSEFTDGVAALPNGGRVYFTRSDNGTYNTYSKRTGFTDETTGNLDNPLPNSPVLVHPVTVNDGEIVMHNYTGSAVWNAPADEPGPMHYDIDYKLVGTETWNQLGGLSIPGYPNYFDFITSTSVLLMGIPSDGNYYQVRVRAYDSTWADPARSGSFIVSEMFRKAKPTIDSLNDGATGLLTGISYYDNTLLINGSGFGSRTTPADRMSSDFHVSFYQGGVEKIIPAKVGPTDKGVEAWENNRITLTIPRSFTDTYLQPGTFDVKVKAFNLYSNAKSLMVGPKLYEARNTLTGELNRGSIGQRIKLTGKGIQADTIVDFYHRLSPTTGVRVHTATVEASFVPPGVDGSSSIDFIVPAGASSYADWYILAYSNGRPNKDTDITFTINTVPVPQISKFQVDTDATSTGVTWQDTTEAFVYDHINIVGTGFGSDPGDGNRAGAFNRVTIAGQTVRDDMGNDGLQVYSWSDTAIDFGVPRRIGTTFINAGSNEVTVTTPGGTAARNIDIRPRVYGVNPDSGVSATSVTVAVNGTALDGGPRDITIGGISGGSGTIIRQDGDEYGRGGNDQVSGITLTLAGVGFQPVVATVNGRVSNNDKPFNVKPAGTPNPLVVIPNVAPNTGPISVRILGSGFVSGAGLGAQLTKTGETAINGTAVTFVDSGKITVTFDLTGKTVGKWDVVVANPGGTSGTISKGFTITSSSDPIAQIIDDFEGVAVTYPDSYSLDGVINLIMSTDKYEGDQAGQVDYTPSLAGFRGYYATLNNEQNLEDFNSMSVRVKTDGASTGKLKLQFTAKSADGLTTKDFAIPEAQYVSLTDTSYTKYTFLMSDLIEVDGSGNPVAGGASFNDYKSRITGYLAGFTGNDGSAAPIKLDLVAAEGYTPPTTEEAGPITTTIVRAGDTVGSGVTLSWVANDGYAGNYNVYRITGAWDAADGIFSNSAAVWGTPWRSGVTSPQTDDTQVGQGTQTYYKVVKSADTLTDAMLATDVVGKFDLGVGPADTQPERALISIPLETSGTTLVSLFGAQPSDNDAIAIVDNSFAITSGRMYIGGWQDIEGFTPLTDLLAGYSFVYTSLNSKFLTVVGKVKVSPNIRTIVGGWDTVSDTAKLSWIGNAYPIPAAIEGTNTGLNALSFGDSAITGAQAAFIDANAGIIGGAAGYALHNTAATWVNSDLASATLKLMPGRGYMLTEPTNPSFTWTQSR